MHKRFDHLRYECPKKLINKDTNAHYIENNDGHDDGVGFQPILGLENKLGFGPIT